jgi:CheY-like chemotaxis protein
MHFNIKKEENANSGGSYAFDEKNFNLNRLLSVDTLTIDHYSRLTFTKEVKSILHVEAGDKIVVYRDKYNNDELLFRVQRGGNSVANWKLKKKNVGIDYDEEKSPSSTITSGTNRGPDFGNDDEPPYRFHNKNEKRNIMLVDDEQDVLFNFRETLSSEGYHVSAFSRSKEALKNLIDLTNPSHYYDLAILDIRMPGINGVQLYQMLKIINKNIKVMFISALDAVDEILSMFPEIDPGNIIRKPVSQSYFVNKVKEIIV